MSRVTGILAAGFLLAGLGPSSAALAGQPAPEPPGSVYAYRGADRSERLIEGARREGAIVLYTSLATSESVPLTQAFERKYGIKVQLWRSISENVLQRAVAEARARRMAADVVETNGPEMEALVREKLLAAFYSPYIEDIAPAAVPAHGKWIGDRTEYFVVAFNTSQVRRSDIPAGYEGFIDPRWRGRVAVEANDEQWLGALMKVWGDARALTFFRQLISQKPEVRAGHVLLAQMVVNGEIPVALTAYGPNAEAMKRQGKPIDWVAVDPLVGRPQGIGLLEGAPHPHAALLFADFVLSPEGQQVLESLSRFPTSRKVRSPLAGRAAVTLDPAEVLAKQEEWRRIWSEGLRR